jgi:calcineurin-like phosphoesterase family protein
MTDFFTSDWHLFHSNIIKYCSRPFKDEQEMKNVIIKRYNEVVKPEDTVYVLGDVAMIGRHGLSKLEPVLHKMNGIKHLILGNHDEGKPFTYERFGFTTVHTALIYNDDVILRHDPATANVMPDKLWLVGHVHNVFRLTTEPVRCYNVGVDVNDFYPVTLDYIYSELDSAIKAKEHTIKVQE